MRSTAACQRWRPMELAASARCIPTTTILKPCSNIWLADKGTELKIVINAQATTPGLSRGLNLPGLGALFVLTLRQHLRGKRLIILSLLFLLPTALAIVARLIPHSPKPDAIEFVLVFYLIPHALITMPALAFSAGIIHDEVEEQTLTYLLMRPIPRWGLYLTKLAATLVVTIGLTCVFTVLAMIVIPLNTPELWGTVISNRVPKVVGLLALTQVSYCALFAIIGMLPRC